MVLLLALSLLQTPAPDPTVYPIGPGITAPQPTARPNPSYTDAARQAGTQGTVWLSGIVETDGRVSDIRVTRTLEPGLDAEAIKAFEQWRFTPGMKDGRPVRVQVTVEMSFNVRGGIPPPAPATPVSVFRRIEPDGSTIVFDIPNERFQRLPSWDPNAVPAPSLATADALRTATEWVGRANPIAGGYTLLAVTLRRFPNPSSNRWFYLVDFMPANRNPQSPTPLTTAVVLFDGAIVEPHR
jgi:TonB family protein